VKKLRLSGAFSDAGGGTRTPDTRIMMTARRGHLRPGRRRSGVLRCSQFASKSGVGRTVGRTVWIRKRTPTAGAPSTQGSERTDRGGPLRPRPSLVAHSAGGRKVAGSKSSRPDYFASTPRAAPVPSVPVVPAAIQSPAWSAALHGSDTLSRATGVGDVQVPRSR
jgi:hypothetical protein